MEDQLLRLPLHQLPLLLQSLGADPPPPIQRAGEGPDRACGRAEVLVVEDNVMHARLLQIWLVDLGCEVRWAADAEQALALLRTFRPRLVVMDLQLPGMDGLALTRLLRQDPALAGTIVVAVTASVRDYCTEDALTAGCDDFVAKPIESEQFTALVARRLGGEA